MVSRTSSGPPLTRDDIKKMKRIAEAYKKMYGKYPSPYIVDPKKD